MKTRPQISICIPTYNQAAYIELGIRSAYGQSYKPFEIIVSNDCSTDNTADILKRLSNEISILKVFNQPDNLGISGNVDFCLRNASGNFIIRLDSDDQLLPNYTEKLLALMLRFPSAGYAHAAVQEIDQEGKFLNQRKLLRDTGYKTGINALRDAVTGYRVAANIVMFRHDVLKQVEYLKGRPNFGEDYHLTSAISAAGYGNVYIDEVLSYYRVWFDGANVRQKRKLSEIEGIRLVFEDVLEPAYLEQNLNLTELIKSRAHFACQQADCLNWDIYSPKEKEEIKVELKKLSSAWVAKFFIWMYSNELAILLKIYVKSKICFRLWIKSAIKKFRYYNFT